MLWLAAPLAADGADSAWLSYAPLEDRIAADRYGDLPAVIVICGESPLLTAAQEELNRGIRGMLGRALRTTSGELPKENAIVLGTYDAVTKAAPNVGKFPELRDDGYVFRTVEVNGERHLVIAAPNERGVLYGAFALVRKIGLAQPLTAMNERHAPVVPLRIVAHRDEAGVPAGDSGPGTWVGAEGGESKDISAAGDYARLLASVGINGTALGNPVAARRAFSAEHLAGYARVAEAFRPWGVRLFLTVDEASLAAVAAAQQTPGGEQGDPWTAIIDALYEALPDLGGLVIHAQPHPAAEVADALPSHAATANAIADALEPHGGVLVYRIHEGPPPAAAAPAADPALVAYAAFRPLDGKLHDNLLLAVGDGTAELHLRQPPSPLLGRLEKTNLAIEFKMAMGSLAQQRHLGFLVPTWKATLDFDMQAKGDETPVKDLVAGKTFDRPTGAFIAVAHVGGEDPLFGHPLASANLYGFGRLAWQPNLASKAIAEEWSRLAFGHDPLVVGTLVDMLLSSWRTYENYTGTLGLGALTGAGEAAYGPALDRALGATANHPPRADQEGLGVDRTSATGSKFVDQYQPPVAKMLETLETCSEEWLLFLHRRPYTHVLGSGKTIIQHIYDAHYLGVREIARMRDKWQLLEGRIDETRHRDVLARLDYQLGHAQVWRDAVCSWFLQKSGVADNQGRVGNYPQRFEAEAMQLAGYEPLHVTPWETASGGQAAECTDAEGRGTLTLRYDGKSGWFTVRIWYFDENDGQSRFRLLVGDQVVDEWTADLRLPDDKPSGHTATRHGSPAIALRPGDEIRIEAAADGGERAAVDYLEIEPVRE